MRHSALVEKRYTLEQKSGTKEKLLENRLVVGSGSNLLCNMEQKYNHEDSALIA